MICRLKTCRAKMAQDHDGTSWPKWRVIMMKHVGRSGVVYNPCAEYKNYLRFITLISPSAMTVLQVYIHIYLCIYLRISKSHIFVENDYNPAFCVVRLAQADLFVAPKREWNLAKSVCRSLFTH